MRGGGAPGGGEARRRSAATRACAVMERLRRAALAAALAGWLVALAAPEAPAAPAMPSPTYDNTLYVFVYDAPVSTDQDYAASKAALLSRVSPRRYTRVGFTTYYQIDLPWNADLTNPVLTSPSSVGLDNLLARLESDGLVYHLSAMLGMSRFPSMYEAAKREDRRNAQWFLDNLIEAPGVGAGQAATRAWTTPSRYARKLRRHMHAKMRAFAQEFVELAAAHPDTLVSASGDAEAELSDARANESLPADSQIIADYSPFAILEFRDWLLHAGLYADGGPYGGQGYKKPKSEDFTQGADALTPENLARFNAVFGTAFTSWSLEYFDWSLSDPIDGDPRALKFRKYKKATFNPLPASGASFVAGGFDAPRAKVDPSKKWWKIWLKFRQQMVRNFGRDVASWITQPGDGGPALAPNQWYTHQIPGDYLSGRRPEGPLPPLTRLRTSGSSMTTAIVPASVASPGLTILDRYELGSFGPPGGYNRTSQFLLDAMEAKHLPNWGIPEYSPSWHIDVGPDLDLNRIKAQWHRAYAAGAHMMAFTPWPHFTDTLNGYALGDFVAEIGDAPRAPWYVPAARDQFVRQLYLDLLRREPTASESSAAVAAIADGTVPRPKLLVDLAASDAANRTVAAVTRFYLGLLGRAPDLAGLTSWMSYLIAGACNATCLDARRQAIVDSMAGTPEFQSRFGGANPSAQTFVTKLFQNLLGRTPSGSDLDLWAGEILAGRLTRAQAARAIAESGESVAFFDRDAFIVLAYLGALGRMPTTAERNDCRQRLNAGLAKIGL